MALNPKRYFTNYFKRKKPLSILFDALFLVLIILLLVPATRKETAAFFIRWTSLPASSLDTDEQYVLSSETYEWQLYTLDGEQISLADLADQPLFVNIWATWCPPCIAELPYIEDLYEQYGKQVRFLLVSNEDPEIVTAFTEKHGYQRSQFYIARYSPSDFSTQSIPATFIVDREGRVVLEKRGAARWNSGKTTRLLDELIKN